MLEWFIFDVSDSVGVVVAAGNGVPVLCDAEEFAEEASAQEETVVPFVKIWHAPLLRHPRVEGNVNVDSRLAVVLLG